MHPHSTFYEERKMPRGTISFPECQFVTEREILQLLIRREIDLVVGPHAKIFDGNIVIACPDGEYAYKVYPVHVMQDMKVPDGMRTLRIALPEEDIIKHKGPPPQNSVET
jgi:hypothetical protein